MFGSPVQVLMEDKIAKDWGYEIRVYDQVLGKGS